MTTDDQITGMLGIYSSNSSLLRCEERGLSPTFWGISGLMSTIASVAAANSSFQVSMTILLYNLVVNLFTLNFCNAWILPLSDFCSHPFQFLCNHLSHLLCHSFCPRLYCLHFYSAAALMFTIVVMPMHLAHSHSSPSPFISFTIQCVAQSAWSTISAI